MLYEWLKEILLEGIWKSEYEKWELIYNLELIINYFPNWYWEFEVEDERIEFYESIQWIVLEDLENIDNR